MSVTTSLSHRPWAKHVDMYAKIPADLMEGTRSGSVLSYISLCIMLILFLYETSAFFSSRYGDTLAFFAINGLGSYQGISSHVMSHNVPFCKIDRLVTDLSLDRSDDPRIRLNFNITMMDLRCDWAVIDVVSVLGTHQNVTAHVTKWNVNGQGVRQGYKGRNRNQKDIDLFDSSVTSTLDELHEDGEDALSLDPETLEYYKKEHDYVFVDFYASWCSHCRDLAPTWETLAEVMVDAGEAHAKIHGEDYTDEDYEAAEKVTMPVVIAKIDCVDHQSLCNFEERISAYPTLRLFVDGKRWHGGDYNGHRTVLEMVEWLYHVEEQHKDLLGQDSAVGDSVRTLHKAHEGTHAMNRKRSQRRHGS